MRATGMIKALFVLGMLVGLRGCAATSRVEPFSPPAGQAEPAAPESAVDPMLSVDTLFEAPPDYALTRIGSDEYPIPPYAKFLQGVKICLDPGHGGDASQRAYKRGPTGVREAEFNLRVAQYLRDLLTKAGAEVLLTREEDVEVSLEARANMANTSGADLFVSCHHNAMDNKPEVNHTTVWYHRDVDYRPSDLDLARYLCQSLLDGIALPDITAVPLKSDQLMYENGFGLLRAARVTAALCETSFYTNPDEEQRLRDPEYNLREAYAIFLGLARYAAGGLPHARLVAPEGGVVTAGTPTMLEFELDDGLRARKSWGYERQMILSDSIAVRVDGKRLPHTFTNEGYRLTVELPTDLTPGEHRVEVQFQNMYKNSVLNPHFVMAVK